MPEYIVFDEDLRDRFVDFIRARNLACEVRPDPIAGYAVRVPDDLAEDVEDELEEEYDALMGLQQDLVEQGDGSDDRSVMAVDVELADGRQLSISVPAVYARRLHENFAIDEIRDLVRTIAEGALDPQTGPLCCRITD